MRYLLDTHIWLWLLDSPTKIASPIRTALGAADELVLSAASVWEIAIKVKLGKLAVQGGVDAARQQMLTAIGARELAITSTHALAAADLPALHRDPFDRILVAQAIAEGLVLVTADDVVRRLSGRCSSSETANGGIAHVARYGAACREAMCVRVVREPGSHAHG